MILIAHILIALASIVYTTYLYIAPAKSKFPAAYALVGLTIVSGTILVVTTHSPILQSCMTGLVYLAVVTSSIGAAYYRLVNQTVDHE